MKHDNDLRCHKNTQENISHGRERGKLRCFLGLRIRQEEGKVTVNQERYIEKMLELIHHCKPPRTSACLNLKLLTSQNGDKEVYQKIHKKLG